MSEDPVVGYGRRAPRHPRRRLRFLTLPVSVALLLLVVVVPLAIT